MKWGLEYKGKFSKALGKMQMNIECKVTSNCHIFWKLIANGLLYSFMSKQYFRHKVIVGK